MNDLLQHVHLETVDFDNPFNKFRVNIDRNNINGSYLDIPKKEGIRLLQLINDYSLLIIYNYLCTPMLS